MTKQIFTKTLLFLALFLFSTSSFEQKKADLRIKDIEYPDVSESGGTDIYIIVSNKGNATAENVEVKVWDVDLFLNEAIDAWGIDEGDYWIFEENAARAEDGQRDYDDDWEKTVIIPKLEAGETVRIHVHVDHWIYDSNCEVGAEVDPNQKIDEKDEGNNKKGFFAGG
ncbi:MAG: hypothetical protein MI810_10025 [Flavobacteriales bacterium]|nr:hypothetical protein [Flavobacteriales bacterium]